MKGLIVYIASCQIEDVYKMKEKLLYYGSVVKSQSTHVCKIRVPYFYFNHGIKPRACLESKIPSR